MSTALEIKRQLWSEHIAPFLRTTESGCQEWPFAVNHAGYGIVSVSSKGKQRTLRVHRIALEVSLGRELGPLHACHRCDNPRCANPLHLFEGTDNENRLDAVGKGRSVFGVAGAQTFSRGETHHSAKLNPDKVRDIRRKVAGGLPFGEVAKEYGLAVTTVKRICRRITWKHVA